MIENEIYVAKVLMPEHGVFTVRVDESLVASGKVKPGTTGKFIVALDYGEDVGRVFCVEQYRLRGNLPSAGVLAMFQNLKLDKFLTRNFEVLHSQSTEYILHEIDLFIRKRR